MKDPDAMRFRERTRTAQRPQRNLLTRALHFDIVSYFEMQRCPHGIGDDNTAGRVNTESKIHSGITLWADPLFNAI